MSHSYTTGATNCTGTLPNNFQGRVDIVQTESIDNNTSSIAWYFYIWANQASSYNYNYQNQVYVDINGSRVYSNGSIGNVSLAGTSSSNPRLLASGTTTVSHNADGTKVLAVAASYIQTQASVLYSINPSANITLTTIPRTSIATLSSNTVTLGGSVTVYTNRASSSFTHTIQASVGGGAYTTVATGVASSYTYTPPYSCADSYPSATSGNIIIKCMTYSGSTYIGECVLGLTFYIPSNSEFLPTVGAPSMYDLNATTRGWGIWVQGQSYARSSWSSESIKHSASVRSRSSQYFSGSSAVGGAVGSASPATLPVIPISGSIKSRISITDTRGFSCYSESSAVTVYPWAKPAIVSFTAQRCSNSSGSTIDPAGAYMIITCTYKIYPCNNKNGRSLTLFYKKSTESSYTSISITMSSYETTITRVVAADTTAQYDLFASLYDTFTSSAPTQSWITVPTATSFIDILVNSNGKKTAMGIGTTVPNGTADNSLLIGMNTNFTGTIKKNGSPSLAELTYTVVSTW